MQKRIVKKLIHAACNSFLCAMCMVCETLMKVVNNQPGAAFLVSSATRFTVVLKSGITDTRKLE